MQYITKSPNNDLTNRLNIKEYYYEFEWDINEPSVNDVIIPFNTTVSNAYILSAFVYTNWHKAYGVVKCFDNNLMRINIINNETYGTSQIKLASVRVLYIN